MSFAEQMRAGARARNMAVALVIAALLPVAALAQAIKVPNPADLKKDGLKPLSDEQLKAAFSDATVYFQGTATPTRVTFYYRTDGTRVGKLGGRTFEGKWWVKDGLRCEVSVRGGDLCAAVFREGDQYYHCAEGKDECEFEMRIVKGNKEGL